MFVESLRNVVDQTDGAIASLLMDFEGIPLESYVKEGTEVPFDIEVVGAEFSVVVKNVQRTTAALSAGDPIEVAVQTDTMTTIIRVLTTEYFVALAMKPTGNIGKGRYLLRVAAPSLVGELG